MEKIYRNTNSPQIKEFEKLLNAEFSKSKAEENQICQGVISRKTDKVVYVDIKNAKSEGIIELSELKLLKEDNLEVGSKIDVIVEKMEDRDGNIIISRVKCKQLKIWNQLKNSYEKKEEVQGSIIQKIKGGFIVSVQGTMCFLPGSQVDLMPLKNIDHLMKEPQRFLIVKCDKIRGNIVLSRRAILENMRNASKDEIISKYKVGDIVEGICKGITAYGVFFDIDGFDCMCHVNCVSWSRISHPDDLFTIGQKQKLKIINIDTLVKKISVSIKDLTQDPFEKNINNFKIGETYTAEVKKIMDYGIFLSLEEGLEGLCHQSELQHSKKNVSAKKMFTISQKIKVCIKEIDLEKKRISLSHKDTFPSPWKEFENKLGSIVSCKIVNITDFGLFVSIKDYNLEGMVHFKDLNYSESEDELKNFSKNQDLNLKVIEIDTKKEKIRLGLKQLMPDLLVEYFKKKSIKDIITVTVKEILDNAIKVSPDGCGDLKFSIKKNQIAIDKQDQRVTRFTRGDRLDVYGPGM